MALTPPQNKPTPSEIAALNGNYLLDATYRNTLFDFLCNEGSGTVLNDISGNDLHASSPNTDPGDWTDTGIRFDGGAEQAQTSPSALLQVVGDLSIEMWVRVNTWVNSQGLLEIAGGAGETEAENDIIQIILTQASSATDYRVLHEYGPGNNEIPAEFNANTLTGTVYHLVWVRDSTAKTYKMYIDGVPLSTNAYVNQATISGALTALAISGRVGVTGTHTATYYRVRGAATKWTDTEVLSFYTNPFRMFKMHTVDPAVNILNLDTDVGLSGWSALEGASKTSTRVTFSQEASGVPGRVEYQFIPNRFALNTAHRFTGFVTPVTLNYPHTDIKWFVRNDTTGLIKYHQMTLDGHSDQGGQSEIGEAKPFNIVFHSTSDTDQFTIGFENFANNQPGCEFDVSGLGVYIVV